MLTQLENKNKVTMSASKHSGENQSGIEMQIRFIPLKAENEPEPKKCKISVLVDDKLKGTPDNLRMLEIPMITKLEREGETFVLNRIKITNTIFHPKGWTQADSLIIRLEKYSMFMENRAKSDFMVCQRKARAEFVDFFAFPAKESAKVTALKTQQDVFLTWLAEPKSLFKLNYISSLTADPAEVAASFESVVRDYENSIMYFCGQKLWKDHRNAFREHKKYFFNKIAKPFNMCIVDYNDRMREYGETLRYLQPPSRKGSKKAADAEWAALESVTEEDIRTATYDALPREYKTHIEGQYNTDFRDMDEIEFLEAMLSFEVIDKARLSQRDAEKQKRKETSKKFKKRTSEENDDETFPPKRRYQEKKGAGRKKKFCRICKEKEGGKYWTHDTMDCFVKDRAEAREKESNAMDTVNKQLAEMASTIETLKSKLSSDGESD